MTRDAWHVVETEGALTLARRLPARFDVVVETRLPALRPLALAHEVRKDVWRCLCRLRGFSPAVEVRAAGGGLVLRAGGRIEGPVPPGTEARLHALLADPARRARWIAHAARRDSSGGGRGSGTARA